MNLNYAKRIVNDNIFVRHHFFYKGVRNQSEEFDGKIIKAYPSIFIIELLDNTIKSFSYNDIIVGNIKIVK